MRISDWSSDVCSSDLSSSNLKCDEHAHQERAGEQHHHAKRRDIHRRFRHIVAVDFLTHGPHILNHRILMGCAVLTGLVVTGGGDHVWDSTAFAMAAREIGSASCRDRVCQYVLFSVVAVTLTKNFLIFLSLLLLFF